MSPFYDSNAGPEPRRNTRSPAVIVWLLIGSPFACVVFTIIAYLWKLWIAGAG